MKKIYLLTVGLLLAFQLGVFAKDKDTYVPPVVPNAGNIFQNIQDEEKNCKDISPTKKGNCGKDLDKDDHGKGKDKDKDK